MKICPYCHRKLKTYTTLKYKDKVFKIHKICKENLEKRAKKENTDVVGYLL